MCVFPFHIHILAYLARLSSVFKVNKCTGTAANHLQLKVSLCVKGYDGLAAVCPWSSHCSVHAYQYPTRHDLVLIAESFVVIVAVREQLGARGSKPPALVYEYDLAC